MDSPFPMDDYLFNPEIASLLVDSPPPSLSTVGDVLDGFNDDQATHAILHGGNPPPPAGLDGQEAAKTTLIQPPPHEATNESHGVDAIPTEMAMPEALMGSQVAVEAAPMVAVDPEPQGMMQVVDAPVVDMAVFDQEPEGWIPAVVEAPMVDMVVLDQEPQGWIPVVEAAPMAAEGVVVDHGPDQVEVPLAGRVVVDAPPRRRRSRTLRRGRAPWSMGTLREEGVVINEEPRTRKRERTPTVEAPPAEEPVVADRQSRRRRTGRAPRLEAPGADEAVVADRQPQRRRTGRAPSWVEPSRVEGMVVDEQPQRRGRGRPPRVATPRAEVAVVGEQPQPPRRGRGRPRRVQPPRPEGMVVDEQPQPQPQRRRRGRAPRLAPRDEGSAVEEPPRRRRGRAPTFDEPVVEPGRNAAEAPRQRRRRAPRVPDYSWMTEGWAMYTRPRRNGKFAGYEDKFFRAPGVGKAFRSARQARAYMEEQKKSLEEATRNAAAAEDNEGEESPAVPSTRGQIAEDESSDDFDVVG